MLRRMIAAFKAAWIVDDDNANSLTNLDMLQRYGYRDYYNHRKANHDH